MTCTQSESAVSETASVIAVVVANSDANSESGSDAMASVTEVSIELPSAMA